MKLFVKRLFFLIAGILLLFAGSSCATKNVETNPTYSYDESADDVASDEMFLSQRMERADYGSQKSAKARIGKKTASKPSKRMVHYNGYAKLKVVKPTDTLDKASEIVKRAGGYVEKRRDRSAGFRVPVEHFKRIYKEILDLGIVLKKAVTAEDVTDQYTDMALRLNVSKKALKRYMELLARAKDEEEKIRLLKEISRLNESIEYLENSVKLLSLLANYSRINLDTIPYDIGISRKKVNDIKAFNWINQLTPFSRKIAKKGKKLAFDVPEKLVLIKGDTWRTESADGTSFWAHKRANNPDGDTTFWINAMKVRLEKEFASVEVKTAGQFHYLKLVSLSEKPYIYYIGVQADNTDLNLFEAYFPDKKQEEAYRDAILKVLE